MCCNRATTAPHVRRQPAGNEGRAWKPLRIMEEDGLLENAARWASICHGIADGLIGVKGLKSAAGADDLASARPCPAGDLLGQGGRGGPAHQRHADTVVRLLPPLILSAAEADEIVAILVPLIRIPFPP